MQQINFVIGFIICLALVLFSLENIDPVVVHVVPGTAIEAPLAIELLLAMGLGAIVAWLFGIWNRLQRQMQSGRSTDRLRAKDEQIQTLQQDLETLQKDVSSYQAELEKQRQMLPPAKENRPTAESTEGV